MNKKIKNKKIIKEKSSLRFEGIYENGYGLISKSFMKDTRLTIEAKSIYAYLCTYCGGGTTAFPSVSLQCSDLCISENRYYKHRKLLEEFGYIKIEQQKELVEYSDGTTKEYFTNNIYTIVLNIAEKFKNKKATAKKIIKNRTVKKAISKKTDVSETVDISALTPNLQFEGTDFEGMDFGGNNNNNFDNNNFNNNNIILSSSKEKDIEEIEEDKFESDLKMLMSFCNRVNFKLKKDKAKSILKVYAVDKVIKAITHIIGSVDISCIRNFAGYLLATLKDMSIIKKVVIENKIENGNKTSNFANFTQRQYDYDKLEAQLLGYDLESDLEEIEIKDTKVSSDFSECEGMSALQELQFLMEQ